MQRRVSRRDGMSSNGGGSPHLLRENWYVLIDEDTHCFSVVDPALDDVHLFPRWQRAHTTEHRNVRMYTVRITATREPVMAHAHKLGYRFSGARDLLGPC